MHQPCFPPYLPPCAKVDSSAYNAFSPDVHVSSMVFPVVEHACAHILSCFSRVRLCATLWTVVCQAPLSLGFSRQEYWSGLPCPPPGDLPNPGIKPVSSAVPILQAESLPLGHQGCLCVVVGPNKYLLNVSCALLKS